MNFQQPIGSSEWAGFFLRIPLGTFFTLASLMKIQNVDAFIETVKDFGLFQNEHLITTIGFIFPWLELIIGVLMILGLWTNLCCIAAMVILGSIIYAYGLVPPSVPFNKDLILFFVVVALMFTGAGKFSIDHYKFKN